MAFICRKYAKLSPAVISGSVLTQTGRVLTSSRTRIQQNSAPHQSQIRSLNFWPPFLSTSNLDQSKTLEQILSKAEKIVGYPTSFLGLRFLLSDEFSNIVMYIRKIVGTKHPLLSTIRTMLNEGKNGLQTRGLLVLLISKAANFSDHNFKNRDTEVNDMTNGIYPGQRAIAEIAEMIHTAYIIHKDVVNLALLKINALGRCENFEDLHNGNKMAILSGDFLLAQACKGLAELQNTKVVELMSEAIGEITEGQFVDLISPPVSGPENDPPLNRPSIDLWNRRNFLTSGSLVSKSCRSALEFAGHTEALKWNAENLARNITTAKRLQTDSLKIESGNLIAELSYSDIVSLAPVVIHCETEQISPPPPDEKDDKIMRDFLADVRQSRSVDTASSLRLHHSEIASESLGYFPHSDAKETLQDIIRAVSEC